MKKLKRRDILTGDYNVENKQWALRLLNTEASVYIMFVCGRADPSASFSC